MAAPPFAPRVCAPRLVPGIVAVRGVGSLATRPGFSKLSQTRAGRSVFVLSKRHEPTPKFCDKAADIISFSMVFKSGKARPFERQSKVLHKWQRVPLIGEDRICSREWYQDCIRHP